MAFLYKKTMGPHQSPMAFHPILGMALWVTRFKIKVKVIKIKVLVHDLSLEAILNLLDHECQGGILRFLEEPRNP